MHSLRALQAIAKPVIDQLTHSAENTISMSASNGEEDSDDPTSHTYPSPKEGENDTANVNSVEQSDSRAMHRSADAVGHAVDDKQEEHPQPNYTNTAMSTAASTHTQSNNSLNKLYSHTHDSRSMTGGNGYASYLDGHSNSAANSRPSDASRYQSAIDIDEEQQQQIQATLHAVQDGHHTQRPVQGSPREEALQSLHENSHAQRDATHSARREHSGVIPSVSSDSPLHETGAATANDAAHDHHRENDPNTFHAVAQSTRDQRADAEGGDACDNRPPALDLGALHTHRRVPQSMRQAPHNHHRLITRTHSSRNPAPWSSAGTDSRSNTPVRVNTVTNRSSMRSSKRGHSNIHILDHKTNNNNDDRTSPVQSVGAPRTMTRSAHMQRSNTPRRSSRARSLFGVRSNTHLPYPYIDSPDNNSVNVDVATHDAQHSMHEILRRASVVSAARFHESRRAAAVLHVTGLPDENNASARTFLTEGEVYALERMAAKEAQRSSAVARARQASVQRADVMIRDQLEQDTRALERLRGLREQREQQREERVQLHARRQHEARQRRDEMEEQHRHVLQEKMHRSRANSATPAWSGRRQSTSRGSISPRNVNYIDSDGKRDNNIDEDSGTTVNNEVNGARQDGAKTSRNTPRGSMSSSTARDAFAMLWAKHNYAMLSPHTYHHSPSNGEDEDNIHNSHNRAIRRSGSHQIAPGRYAARNSAAKETSRGGGNSVVQHNRADANAEHNGSSNNNIVQHNATSSTDENVNERKGVKASRLFGSLSRQGRSLSLRPHSGSASRLRHRRSSRTPVQSGSGAPGARVAGANSSEDGGDNREDDSVNRLSESHDESKLEDEDRSQRYGKMISPVKSPQQWRAPSMQHARAWH